MPEPGAAWTWLLPGGGQQQDGNNDQTNQWVIDTAYQYGLDPNDPQQYAQAQALWAQNMQSLNLLSQQFGVSPETIAAAQAAAKSGIFTTTQVGDWLTGQGGPGGTDNSLGWAQLAESQKQHAFDRVSAKIQLLQATDQLQESRKENALNALTSAIPYLVSPDMQYVPGYEPGGAGQTLGSLLGTNVQPQKLVRQDIPLGDYLQSPTTVTPDYINSQLAGVM